MNSFLDYIISEKSDGMILPTMKRGEVLVQKEKKERLDCVNMAGLIHLNYIAASELQELTMQMSLSLNRIKE